MKELLLPLGLVALGVLLLASETFIPSGGVLGVLAVLALLCGVASAFYYGGFVTGTVFMTATFVSVGVLVAYMIHKWPHTTIGKLILVEPPNEDQLLPDRSEIHALVGRVGQAVAVMLPGGFVEIDSKRYDATAVSTVEQGTWVEVVGVRSGRILLVRPVSEEVALQAALEAEREQTRQQDPLSMPAGEGVPDPFDDALG